MLPSVFLRCQLYHRLCQNRTFAQVFCSLVFINVNYWPGLRSIS
ncbi:Hypothetical protein RY69_198 [Bifidobacterium breve]|nr:Hypothetical protein RY69_198 [Bifidobacterium breve]